MRGPWWRPRRVMEAERREHVDEETDEPDEEHDEHAKVPEQCLHRVKGDEAGVALFGEVDDEWSNEPGENRQDMREHRRGSFVGRRFGPADGECLHDGVIPRAAASGWLCELTRRRLFPRSLRGTLGGSAHHHTPFIAILVVEVVMAHDLDETPDSVSGDLPFTNHGRHISCCELFRALEVVEASYPLSEDHVPMLAHSPSSSRSRRNRSNDSISLGVA